MSRISRFGAVLGLLCGSTVATGQPLVFETTDLDLGELTSLLPLDLEIRVRNSSTQPVHIRSVKTSCGCTEARIEPNSIAAGAQAALRGTLNPQLNASSVRVYVKYESKSEDFEVALSVSYRYTASVSMFAVPSIAELTLPSYDAPIPISIRFVQLIGDSELLAARTRVVKHPEWLRVPEELREIVHVPKGTRLTRQAIEGLQHRGILRREIEIDAEIDSQKVRGHISPGTSQISGEVLLETGFPPPFDLWRYVVTVRQPPASRAYPSRIIFRPNSPGGTTAVVRLQGAIAETPSQRIRALSDVETEAVIIDSYSLPDAIVVHLTPDARELDAGSVKILLDGLEELTVPWTVE